MTSRGSNSASYSNHIPPALVVHPSAYAMTSETVNAHESSTTQSNHLHSSNNNSNNSNSNKGNYTNLSDFAAHNMSSDDALLSSLAASTAGTVTDLTTMTTSLAHNLIGEVDGDSSVFRPSDEVRISSIEL
uniref:Uncharacterized protein n=1 Tax=Lygus hesperus TaxID=30085 RepID=A0A0A9YY83_LYGHE